MASTANGSSARVQFDTFSNIVNGKCVQTEQTRCGINPATKKSNPPVPSATKQDLDDAVQAARAAFVKWSKSTIEERQAAVVGFAEALKEQEEDFAKLLTMEQGKPVRNLSSSRSTRPCYVHGAFTDRL